MNRTSIFTGLGIALAGGVALVGGIALGDALDDQPTLPAAAPAEQTPPAALAPDALVVTDADGEAVEDASVTLDLGPDGAGPPRPRVVPPPVPDGPADLSDDTAAVLAVADEVVAQAEAVAAGDAEPEPFEPPTDAADVADDSPAAHTPTPDELIPDPPDDDGPDFIDLCAGEAAGTPPPEGFGCPDDGIGGTVLALTSDPSSELGIDLGFVLIATNSEAFANDRGPDQVAWGYCDYSSMPAGELPIYVLATRPIDVAVEHGAPGSPAGTVEATTPDARLENIALMVDAYGAETDPRLARAQACTSVPAPDGPDLELTVTATDSSGAEVTETFTVPTSGGLFDFREPAPAPEPATPPPPEPPVREAEIHGFDGRVARIVAPQGDPARERVHIATVAVSGPEASTETCASVQQSVFDGSRVDRRLYNWEVTPRFDIPSFDPAEHIRDLFGLDGGEEEVDPNEGLDHQTVVWMTGDDGAVYDVCVWWTGNPTTGSTFATPPIVEQRRYRVHAPDRYMITVELVELYLWRPAAAGQYTTEVFGRRASFPATDLPQSPASAPGRLANVLTEPIVLGTTVAGDTPLQSRLEITNTAVDGQWAVSLPTRVNACDGTDEGICISGVDLDRFFEVPGRGAELTTCLGNGCGTPTLSSDNQDGWARVRILHTDHDGGTAPDRFSGTWRTAEAADFRGDPVVRPETPRLDTGLTRLQDPIGGFSMPSGTIRGTIVFDRPVTGEIQVDAVIADDPAACDRDPVVIGPEPTQVVNLNLSGLCRDAIYAFPASVVDAAGNRAEIPGRAPLAGFTRALNVRWSVDLEVTAVHGGTDVTLEGGAFGFDDKTETAGEDRCLRPGYHVATPPHTTYRPSEDSLLEPTFTVGATLHLRAGCGAGGAAHTEHWEAELSTDLLEALFFDAGRTQTSTIEVTGPVVDYTVTLRIEHIDRPTCRGGVCPSTV